MNQTLDPPLNNIVVLMFEQRTKNCNLTVSFAKWLPLVVGAARVLETSQVTN